MLILYQRVFFGECSNPRNQVLKDLSFRELVVLLPFVVMMVVMGVFPNFFLDKLALSLNSMFEFIPHVNISWIL